ncbi:glycosyltransferase family 4 protein [Paenibacillus thermoaerophilus]|uniref:Glycosyltransferase family 4 protein n=1 Tax=Paenibacillus thermoaerophilus TaxID=1215385 RepID=A0ABW2V449_9BACL|nr:glycosyltransferase family 4 protein [Paenibacillus thermoaerophilus]TMV16163.1 glycosyltransferase family 4 protein [Paenibacillus thermoaerophilus]
MYRVAYLDHTSRWSGGEIALYNLLVHLDDTIKPIVILAEDGPLAERLKDRGVDVRVLVLDEKVRNRNRNDLNWHLLTSAFKAFRYGRQIGRLLREERVACVHTNSLKAAFYGAVAARRAGVPLIWHIHDIIEAPYLRKIVARMIKLFVKVLPDGIIANSNATMSTLNLSRSPYPKQTIVYPSFAGYAGRKATRRPEGAKRPFVVLLAGRIGGWKGQHVLLEAAKSFIDDPNVEFWIAGDALFQEDLHYKEQLLRTIAIERLTNVKMLGHVDNVAELMDQADLLVHTSVIPEPFGQVIIEGMAAGLPVVAADAGGPREIVLHRETGLLIPSGQANLLREAIQWMVEHPEERNRMGERAMNRVKELFLIERTVNQIKAFYPEVIGSQ